MEILAPALAAALHELQVLDPRRRPMLAAHWVAQGHGGEELAQLAGLSGGEREVSDLWPAALRELGVATPVGRARRIAVPWLADRVASGEEDLTWMVRVLWPTRQEDTDEDPLMDRIVYTIDGHLDHVGDLTEREANAGWWSRRRLRQDRENVERVREALVLALEALRRGDLDAAAAALRVAPPSPRASAP